MRGRRLTRARHAPRLLPPSEGCQLLPHGDRLQPVRAQPRTALRPGTGRHHHRVPRRHVARSHHDGGAPTRDDTAAERRVVVAARAAAARTRCCSRYLFMPLSVGRPSSLAAVEAALATEEKTLRGRRPARRRPTNSPASTTCYTVGTRAVIKKMARGEGVIELIVQGVERVTPAEGRADRAVPQGRAAAALARGPRHRGRGPATGPSSSWPAGCWSWPRSQAPVNIQQLAAQAQDPLQLAYLLGSMLSLDVPKEQALLEAPHAAGGAATAARLPDPRGAGAGAAAEDHQPGRDGDDQGAARVHAAPADAGHPGGTGREEPRKGRGRRSCAAGWPRPTCPTRCARRPSASWTGWSGCRRPPPTTR